MGKKQVSSTRQQTITKDRLRTRAISFYLQEHRDELLTRLKKVEQKNTYVKRHALEREARRDFRAIPDSEQARFFRMVETSCVAAHQLSLVHAREARLQESGRQEFGRQDVFASTAAHLKMSSPPRIHRQALNCSPPRVARGLAEPCAVSDALVPHDTAPSATKQPKASQGTRSQLLIQSQWPCTGQNPVRDGLVRAVPHVRVLYGDAEAAEVLAHGASDYERRGKQFGFVACPCNRQDCHYCWSERQHGADGTSRGSSEIVD